MMSAPEHWDMGTLDLLVCAECAAKNTIDGSFCRQCGVPLPEILREEMKAEAEKLLIDGRQLLSDGRTHEASLVADSVLEVDPANANALALRGDIFEKDGQFIEALETYRRVAEIRTDNTLDRIRIAHLEKLVAAEEIALEEPSNSRRGVLLVAAAGVLLASVGAALFLAGNGSGAGETEGLIASNDNVSGFTQLDPTMVPTVPKVIDGASSVPGSSPGNVSQPNTNTGSVDYAPSNPSPGYTSTPFQRTPADNGLAPFQPNVNLQPFPGVGQVRPDNGQPTTQPPGNTARPDTETETAEPPKDPEGVIEIRVKPGQENSNPGASSGGAMTAEQLIQKARNLYVQENYAGAAQAYEAAIKGGASSGATYQRLAQCYEKLGRRSDAVRSYRNAVRAFDSQLARGGSDSVRAAKESCERAISNLGG